KTAIFNWLQDKKITENIKVTKFNLQLTINPVAIAPLKEHTSYQVGLKWIQEVAEQNPTLTNLLEQLLYRYIFVRYPMVPNEEEMIYVVKAMNEIGKQTLHIDDQLEMCEHA